jgi:hypothetical protein
MKTLLKKLCILTLLILSVLLAGRAWYWAKDGFSINRIRCTLSIQNSNPIEEKLAASCLQGPFHYLGRGRQCYVFGSQDMRYVIKIPRFDRYRLPFFWQAMPSHYDSKKRGILQGRLSRLYFTLESFKIAANDLRDETAVIYLHLHQTNNLPKQFVIYDRLHRPFTINLNHTAFILQERKSLMMPGFLSALERNDRQEAERMLLAFLDTIDRRAEKGIFNRDPSFLKNFGWDGKKSIQIDIGSFWRKDDLTSREAHRLSLIEGSARIQEWLAEVDPDMLEKYNRHLDEKLVCLQ